MAPGLRVRRRKRSRSDDVSHTILMKLMSRPSALVLLFVLGMFMLPTVAEASGIVLRYLPAREELSTPMQTAAINVAPFTGTPEATVRSQWGLPATMAATFEAPASTMRSEETEDLRQGLGPAITAEVWIRPSSIEGDVTLITNRVADSDGFRLAMLDGVPYAEIDANGSTYRVDATAAVAADSDHWVAVTFQRSGATLRLSLYVDGRLSAQTSSEGQLLPLYTVARPFFVGTDATGDGTELSGSYSGLLYAAMVRDYVARQEYLTSGLPKDGSMYMGLPAFLDQPIDGFAAGMDQRIATSPTPVRHRFFLPFVNDNYVPQGTATGFDVDGADTTAALVYVAYYHMTRSGVAESKPSVIAEIDVATGQMRRGFRLRGTLGRSHAGGIAYYKGALFVSSRSILERYPLPDYDPSQPRLLDLHADEDGTITVASKASYVSAHNDTLWVGDWRPGNDVAPFLYGYPTDAEGRPIAGQTSAVYSIPRNIQGVDFFEHDGVQYVLMVRNRSSSEAEILRMKRSALSPYRVPTAEESIPAVHGIEDVSFWPDGTFWTNSESGTDYYQNTAGWSRFYPFVYSIAGHRLIPGLTSVSSEMRPLPASGSTLGSFPNPFRDSATITLNVEVPGNWSVVIMDVLGRIVARVTDGTLGAGDHSFRVDASGLAPGVYFTVAEGPLERISRPLTVVR